MIKIHLSFWLAAFVFWFFGLGLAFLMVAIAVSTHELAHVLTAKAFGCEIKELRLSALGEMALIHHMDKLSAWRRSAVIVAGPFWNFFLYIAALLAAEAGLSFGAFDIEMFGLYNLVLCGFNLLPIFPLDGARLFQLWAGNIVGIMPANRWTLRAGRLCCVVLMLLGVVQAVLYAPNFTMLLAGFFLWYRNRDLQIQLSAEFYMAMMGKGLWLQNKSLPAKIIYTHPNQALNSIVDRMGWDNMLLLLVPEKNNAIINESQIIDHISKHGLQGKVKDI